ncbi:LIC12611 family phage tail protein [Leptospira santarosai]|uniref:Uncharacterized protein n=1 Tax=Leptospira santarosai serovar Arenal str. MAVJ 401 TaxID=1049976 RepID=M6JXA2_9LEPT|nr:hypothetical protein [Leptospira santarosai]EMN20102.1 hypothetical protein LEP1GSC063_2706 [Leptospira santarosai serovar Arenal str. MAVJ 401]
MSLRQLNVALNLKEGSATDALKEVKDELDSVKTQFADLGGDLDLFTDTQAAAFKEFGESIGDSLAGKVDPAISELAKKFHTTESNIERLISKSREDLKLDSELIATAKAAGLTDKELEKLNQEMSGTANSAGSLSGMLRQVAAIGIAFAVGSFATASIEAATALEKQNGILQTLSGSQYPKLQSAITQTIQDSKGLASEGSLSQVANDAMKAGMSVDFISKNLSGLSQVAEVTGSDLSSSMAEAYQSIQTGSDDFLKKNKALFSSYTKEFNQINNSAMTEVSKRLAREKLISSALKENAALQDAYGSHLKSASAIFQSYNQRMGDLKVIFGKVLLEGMKPFLATFVSILEYFTVGEDSVNRVKGALVIFGSVFTGVLVAIAAKMAITSAATAGGMIPALYGMAVAGWAAIAPWIPFIALGAAVAATIAAIVLIVDDLLVWMDGGESIIGDFLGPFKDFDIKKIFGQAFDYLINLAKKYGKQLITALFPVSFISAHFDEIIEWFKSLPEIMGNLFKDIGPKIKEAFSGILPSGIFNFGKPGKADNVTNVHDAIITKSGKVIHTHPDDNLVAVKDLGSLGRSKSSGGIVVNIANVVLGAGSPSENAHIFAEYLERELEKIAIKIGLGSGLSPEAM